jgi:hypothetical protein
MGLLGVILSAAIRLRRIETTYFHQKSVRVNDLEGMLAALDEHDHTFRYSVATLDVLATGARLGKGVLTVGVQAILVLPKKESWLCKPIPILPGFQVKVDRRGAPIGNLSRQSRFANLTRADDRYSGLFRQKMLNRWRYGSLNHHCITKHSLSICMVVPIGSLEQYDGVGGLTGRSRPTTTRRAEEFIDCERGLDGVVDEDVHPFA